MSARTPPLPALRAFAALVRLGSINAAADELKLATSRNCMTCHTVERRVVGPSYKSVAQKYRNDPAAVDKLAPLIRAGGSGSFGAVPMPASPQVTDAEARRLAVWILGLK